jgi:hypothetical protein
MASPLEQLLARRNGFTPRLNAIARERAKERTNFKSARARKPELPHVSNIPVRTAAVSEQTAGTEIEVKRGSAESGSSPGWYEVQFQEPFIDDSTPHVVGTVVNREGDLRNEGPEQEPPEHDPGETEDTSFPDFSIDGASVDGVGIEPADLPDVSKSDKQVSQKDVGEFAVEGLEAVAEALDIADVNLQFNRNIQEVGIEFGEIQADVTDVDDRFTFESAWKSSARDIGEAYGVVTRQIIIDTVPDAGFNVDGQLANAFDQLYAELYGANSQTSNASGEGYLESAFGAFGAGLDDTMKDVFGDRAQDFLEGFDSTNTEMGSFARNTLTPKINQLGRDTDDTFQRIDNVFQQDIQPQLEANQEAVNIMKERIESAINDNFGLIEEQTQGQRDNVQQPLDELVTELEEAFASVDQDIDDLQNQFGTSIDQLNQNVNDAFAERDAAINDALATIADNTAASMEDMSSEVDGVLNDVIAIVQTALDDQNEVNNEAYQELAALSQNAMDQAPARVYEEIGAPDGQLIAPLQIRNIDETGFEFLGYDGGTAINWVAVGVVEGEGDSDGGTTESEMSISGPTSIPSGSEFSWTAGNVPSEADRVEWDFGDGSTATGTTASHTYDTAGQYTMVATAASGGQTLDSADLTITVSSGGGDGGGGGGDGGEEPPGDDLPLPEPPGILPIFRDLEGISEE